MTIIDFILNLAALLLWLNWFSARLDPLTRTSAVSLAGTLRRAEPRHMKAWALPVGLAGLLFGRALAYSQIGPAAEWTPKLDLYAVVLAFRSDSPGQTLLFSMLSFGRVLVIAYFWLLALAALNRPSGEAGPLLAIVRQHLGPVGRWPWLVQLMAPLVVVAGLWLILHPVLVYSGTVERGTAFFRVLAQGAVLGAALYLTLKYLLPAILLAYLVSSYVYLGRSPVWSFVNATGQSLIAPLRRVPLKVGRVDFAPVLAAILILLLFEALPNFLGASYPRLGQAMWPR